MVSSRDVLACMAASARPFGAQYSANTDVDPKRASNTLPRLAFVGAAFNP